MSTFLSTHTIGRAFIISKKKKKDMFELSLSSIRQICGHMFTYPCIDLSSLRLDYIQCSNFHEPHLPMHSYINHMFLLGPYIYAFYISALRLIVHVHIKRISYEDNKIVK